MFLFIHACSISDAKSHSFVIGLGFLEVIAVKL